MSESAIFSRKYCETAAKVHRSPKCPEDFPHFWKGDCFKVIDVIARATKIRAEMFFRIIF